VKLSAFYKGSDLKKAHRRKEEEGPQDEEKSPGRRASTDT